MSNDTLLLIDGFNLLSRGYFATAYGKEEGQITRNSEGLFVNALQIFFQKTLNLIPAYGVTHLVVAWDVKRNETTRSQKYDFYKASRGDMPMPLIQQYDACTKILDEIGIGQLSVPSYEADDVIGTLSKNWSGSCFIYSNDKDLYQLLSENVSQIVAGKDGEKLYTLNRFVEDYSIHSQQWIDVKALLGDKSDNIPGCPGVGEKSALPLIQEYGSLERVYEQIEGLDKKFNRVRKKLIDGKELAYISKELSEVICDITELENFLYDDIALSLSNDKIRQVFQAYELRVRLR